MHDYIEKQAVNHRVDKARELSEVCPHTDSILNFNLQKNHSLERFVGLVDAFWVF